MKDQQCHSLTSIARKLLLLEALAISVGHIHYTTFFIINITITIAITTMNTLLTSFKSYFPTYRLRSEIYAMVPKRLMNKYTPHKTKIESKMRSHPSSTARELCGCRQPWETGTGKKATHFQKAIITHRTFMSPLTPISFKRIGFRVAKA